MTTDDERELVRRVTARGDTRAFSALYDRHTPALYALALRLTGGDEREAEEIAHDAWVRAVEKLDTFEWRAALRTWLSGIVIRRWRELARAGARSAGPPIEDLPLPSDDAALQGTADRVDLERAIAALADGYRQVFLLHDVTGYTHEEIAELLDIDPGTSKSQLARARAHLRPALDPTGERHRA